MPTFFLSFAGVILKCRWKSRRNVSTPQTTQIGNVIKTSAFLYQTPSGFSRTGMAAFQNDGRQIGDEHELHLKAPLTISCM